MNGPGYRRRRAGRGFAYYDTDGALIRDDRLDRIRGLAIPPAWTDVWIAPGDDCHLQATGKDARGRKQYLYHDRWTACRDEVTWCTTASLVHSSNSDWSSRSRSSSSRSRRVGSASARYRSASASSSITGHYRQVHACP